VWAGFIACILEAARGCGLAHAQWQGLAAAVPWTVWRVLRAATGWGTHERHFPADRRRHDEPAAPGSSTRTLDRDDPWQFKNVRVA
jgi:homospermidine synthase